MNSLYNILIPLLAGFVGWLFSFLYHRKERKNDLHIKLFTQIEDLTAKYADLSNKYVILQKQVCMLTKENQLFKSKFGDL